MSNIIVIFLVVLFAIYMARISYFEEIKHLKELERIEDEASSLRFRIIERNLQELKRLNRNKEVVNWKEEGF